METNIRGLALDEEYDEKSFPPSFTKMRPFIPLTLESCPLIFLSTPFRPHPFLFTSTPSPGFISHLSISFQFGILAYDQ
jgi:hypothetical protein